MVEIAALKNAGTSDCKQIWTVGHSTRALAEFLDLLAENDISILADVRSYPGSRKFPHFNREELSVSLPDAEVKYVHLKELGGRRKPRPDSHNTVWRNASFRAYADYMETGDFRDGINELLEIASSNRTAIMCSEAVWWRCHRSMISDFLKAGGLRVLHIMGHDQIVEHPFTSAAQVDDGRLFYGPAKEVKPAPAD
jgi:uncharacterized protein (DUF488 family)